jgi:hypothetical protein
LAAAVSERRKPCPDDTTDDAVPDDAPAFAR